MSDIYVVTVNDRPTDAFYSADDAAHFCTVQAMFERHRFNQTDGKDWPAHYQVHSVVLHDKPGSKEGRLSEQESRS